MPIMFMFLCLLFLGFLSNLKILPSLSARANAEFRVPKHYNYRKCVLMLLL